MKDTEVLEKMKTDIDKLKKALSSDENVGKDPLRGILSGLEIPDELIEESKKVFSNPKVHLE